MAYVLRSAFRKQALLIPIMNAVRGMSSSGGPTPPFTTLSVTRPAETITHVEFCRPEKRNAMNKEFWLEMVDCFNQIAQDSECRVVVFSGAGKLFNAGIDLISMASDFLQSGDDTARISWNQRRFITRYQESFTVIEKEVDIGLAADVGTLQRLPSVIGSRSLVNELAFTARKMYADEAKSCGLVSCVFPDKETMMAGALEMAREIATKSPVAVQGTKINLIYSRDHSVPEALNYMNTWNMSMLQTQDVMKSAQAAMEKKNLKEVPFSKL